MHKGRMRRGFLAWKRLGRRDNTCSARRASARRASARRGAAGAAARLRLPSARPAALRAAQKLKLPGTTRAAQGRETKGGLFRSLQLAPRRAFAPLSPKKNVDLIEAERRGCVYAISLSAARVHPRSRCSKSTSAAKPCQSNTLAVPRRGAGFQRHPTTMSGTWIEGERAQATRRAGNQVVPGTTIRVA